MGWTTRGKVNVTLNSTVVTGVGSLFLQDGRIGDGFRGPDGRIYEVTNIATNTGLTIQPPYEGPTVSNATYFLAPFEGYVKDTADALRAASLQIGMLPSTKQDKNANLDALSGLTGAANRIPMFAGLGVMSLATLTANQTLGALTFLATDVLRAAEAVYAARKEFGFYSQDTALSIDTLPGGWCGLVSTSLGGTMPPLTGGFFWLETQQTYSGQSVRQIATQYGGSATDPANANLQPNMAFRIRNQPGTAWGPWARLYTSRDPVSLTSPLSGTNAVDLNTLRTACTDYYITNGVNTPTGGNGYLTVIPLAGTTECYQRYRVVNGSGTYERNQLSGNWGSWKAVIFAEDIALDSAYSWSGSRFKGWAAAAPDSPPINSISVGLDLGYAANRRFQMALDANGKFYTRVNVASAPTTGANWNPIIAEGDYGLGSQLVPQITDFAGDIKPGFYYSYGAAHASAPANGPAGSGGGAVGVVAMQGINNIGYKSFLAVSQQGGSGALFFGSKVTAGAPTWSRVLTQETANLDPALNTGGVISSTVVSGYTITKFIDGFLVIQGIEAGTAVIAANAISTINVTIPAVIANLNLTNVLVNTTPSATNDFGGVTNALMTTGTNCRFTIKNGGTAQSFIPRITILSRWK